MTPRTTSSLKRTGVGRAALAVTLFLALVVGLPMATATLNGLKPGGLPLGYAIVAQGIPLMLALAVLLVRWSPPAGVGERQSDMENRSPSSGRHQLPHDPGSG